MAAAPHVSEGARAFTLDVNEFGTVNRTNVLGVRNAPELQLDDGPYRAYFGPWVQASVVDSSTREDGLGIIHNLPLDVKAVGFVWLTQYGYTAEQQEALLGKWRSLSTQEKDTRSSAWGALDKGNTPEALAFITDLVNFLQAQP